MSQNGSMRYPFSKTQVRTIGRVKIEYTFLLDENKSLKQMVEYCDSVATENNVVILEKNREIQIRQDMLKNRDEKYVIMERQVNTCEYQIKKERRKRYMYIGTTGVAVALLVIALLSGG